MIVGTVKKSTETISWEWFFRKVFQPWDGVLGHRGWADLDAQFQQLAVDSRHAPRGVLGDHLLNQLSLVAAEARSSLTLATTLSPPERLEPASVPSDHSFGLDHDERTPPALPDTSQENPDHAVAVLQRRAFPAAAENLELMPEGDVFEDQRFATAKRPSNQV